jgi:DNA-binding GntR family transcriptional regulator
MNYDAGMRVDRSARTLRDLTLEKMRDAILNLHFRPGERLVERTLCSSLGVSRTVVREVLRHLEAEGLVESIPHQGPAIARIDPTKARQIYEIRALLEAEAARVCATNASVEDIARLKEALDRNEVAFAAGDVQGVLKGSITFYEALFSCAGKEVAWEIFKTLNARISHLRSLTISKPQRGQAAIPEMRRIVSAIEARDGDAAYAASIEHVAVVAELAQSILADITKMEEAPNDLSEVTLRPRAGRRPRAS